MVFFTLHLNYSPHFRNQQLLLNLHATPLFLRPPLCEALLPRMGSVVSFVLFFAECSSIRRPGLKLIYTTVRWHIYIYIYLHRIYIQFSCIFMDLFICAVVQESLHFRAVADEEHTKTHILLMYIMKRQSIYTYLYIFVFFFCLISALISKDNGPEADVIVRQSHVIFCLFC